VRTFIYFAKHSSSCILWYFELLIVAIFHEFCCLKMCCTRFRASASDVWYGSQSQFGGQASALDMWYGSQSQAKSGSVHLKWYRSQGQWFWCVIYKLSQYGRQGKCLWCMLHDSGPVPLTCGIEVRASTSDILYGSQSQCLWCEVQESGPVWEARPAWEQH
jgi:hypothetical protein